MISLIILLILGIAAVAGGITVIISSGMTFVAILGGLLTALGVAFLGAALGIGADRLSPTSRRLNR